MAPQPPAALPGVTPAEMDYLIARAGLTLNAGQTADLVLAWRQVSALSASIPRKPLLADDATGVFRLPPPAKAKAKR